MHRVEVAVLGILVGCSNGATSGHHVFKCRVDEFDVPNMNGPGTVPSGRQCDADWRVSKKFCDEHGCFDRDAVWCIGSEIGSSSIVVCYATQLECDGPTPRGCRETRIDELPKWMLDERDHPNTK